MSVPFQELTEALYGRLTRAKREAESAATCELPQLASKSQGNPTEQSSVCVLGEFNPSA